METPKIVLWNSPMLLPSSYLLAEFCKKTEALILDAKQKFLSDVRRLLNKEKLSSDEFCTNGFIPFLLECTDLPNENMQIDAIYILHFIYANCKENQQQAISEGALPECCIKNLSSKNITVFDWSVHLLTKLVMKNEKIQKIIRENNGIEKIFENIDCDTAPVKTGALIADFARVMNEPHQKFYDYLPILKKNISNDDESILVNSLFFLGYMTFYDEKFCQMTLDSGILDLIIPLTQKPKLQSNIVTIHANFAKWNDEFCQAISNLKVPKVFYEVLSNTNCKNDVKIRIFNFFTWYRKENFIQELFDEGLIYGMLECFEDSSVTHEIVNTLDRLMYNISQNQFYLLVKMNVIPSLLNLLDNCVPKTMKTILHIFCAIFEDEEPLLKSFVDEFKEYGGVDKVKLCLINENEDIADLAKELLDIVQSGIFPKNENWVIVDEKDNV